VTIFNTISLRLARLFKVYSPEEKALSKALKSILGYHALNLEIFKLALIHVSAAKDTDFAQFKESNERLEYLGDAVLGAVVAEYLFQTFPFKNEGFLTEIRSRIVSREALDLLAKKIGLDSLVQYDTSRRNANSFKYIYGDAMEAFIGAVYLDRGFIFCRKFIIRKLINTYLDLDEIVQTDTNYKSKLIEWSQKIGKQISFELISDRNSRHKQFKIQIVLEGKIISEGSGFSKKKAEQDAARKACEELDVPNLSE